MNTDDVAYIWLFYLQEKIPNTKFILIVYSLLHIMPNQMVTEFLTVKTTSYLVEMTCVLLGPVNCIISAKKFQKSLQGYSAPVVHKTNVKN